MPTCLIITNLNLDNFPKIKILLRLDNYNLATYLDDHFKTPFYKNI